MRYVGEKLFGGACMGSRSRRPCQAPWLWLVLPARRKTKQGWFRKGLVTAGTGSSWAQCKQINSSASSMVFAGDVRPDRGADILGYISLTNSMVVF